MKKIFSRVIIGLVFLTIASLIIASPTWATICPVPIARGVYFLRWLVSIGSFLVLSFLLPLGFSLVERQASIEKIPRKTKIKIYFLLTLLGSTIAFISFSVANTVVSYFEAKEAYYWDEAHLRPIFLAALIAFITAYFLLPIYLFTAAIPKAYPLCRKLRVVAIISTYLVPLISTILLILILYMSDVLYAQTPPIEIKDIPVPSCRGVPNNFWLSELMKAFLGTIVAFTTARASRRFFLKSYSSIPKQ